MVLHQLMKICATGKRAIALREAVHRELNIERPLPTCIGNNRKIEKLNILERRTVLGMARYLLDDWPQKFIHLCLAHKVWSAALLRDLHKPPFWYWSVVHDHLYRVTYTPSNQEILSAIMYLERKGQLFTNKDISMCLGKGDIFRKRKDISPILLALERKSSIIQV